jgi:hypothetical protein
VTDVTDVTDNIETKTKWKLIDSHERILSREKSPRAVGAGVNILLKNEMVETG